MSTPPCSREGDLVTIGSRNDVQRAMQEAVETASRSSGNRGPVTQASLAPIRLQVVRVSSEVCGGAPGVFHAP